MLEEFSQNICRQGRVRRPRGYGAIEVDLQEYAPKVKQESFCSVNGYTLRLCAQHWRYAMCSMSFGMRTHECMRSS